MRGPFHLDKELLPIVRTIGEEAAGRSAPAYLVGGIVRDLMLGIRNLDLDIVFEGDAVSLARTLASKLNASLVVHEKFGTATMNLENGLRVDLVTARKETYPHPGALPVVSRGNIRDDLFRRDLTVNAMALAIDPKGLLTLVDEFGGREDLRRKRIRILHELSFQDDPTRILRAVRFEQRFGFRIEAKTLRLLKAALSNRLEERVKPERYFHEFHKMLREPKPWKNIQRLKELNGCGFLGKGVRISAAELGLLRSGQQSVFFYRRAVPHDEIEPALVELMALLYRTREGELDRFIKKFNLSKPHQVCLRQMRRWDMVRRSLSRKAVDPSDVYRALVEFRTETLLFFRAQKSGGLVRRRLDEFLTKLRFVQLSVDGEDLKRLGIEGSQRMGKILDSLLDMKIDGRLATREDELNMAGRLAKEIGPSR